MSTRSHPWFSYYAGHLAPAYEVPPPTGYERATHRTFFTGHFEIGSSPNSIENDHFGYTVDIRTFYTRSNIIEIIRPGLVRHPDPSLSHEFSTHVQKLDSRTQRRLLKQRYLGARDAFRKLIAETETFTQEQYRAFGDTSPELGESFSTESARSQFSTTFIKVRPRTADGRAPLAGALQLEQSILRKETEKPAIETPGLLGAESLGALTDNGALWQSGRFN